MSRASIPYGHRSWQWRVEAHFDRCLHFERAANANSETYSGLHQAEWTFIHVCAYVHTHVHTYKYTYICTHMYIPHIHMYILTYKLMYVFGFNFDTRTACLRAFVVFHIGHEKKLSFFLNFKFFFNNNALNNNATRFYIYICR
jgi:hypothetical protein